jgi:hypothetical protein
MADIRANRVPDELLDRIKHAIVNRKVSSIREAAIEAFEEWLAKGDDVSNRKPMIPEEALAYLDFLENGDPDAVRIVREFVWNHARRKPVLHSTSALMKKGR